LIIAERSDNNFDASSIKALILCAFSLNGPDRFTCREGFFIVYPRKTGSSPFSTECQTSHFGCGQPKQSFPHPYKCKVIAPGFLG